MFALNGCSQGISFRGERQSFCRGGVSEPGVEGQEFDFGQSSSAAASWSGSRQVREILDCEGPAQRKLKMSSQSGPAVVCRQGPSASI